MTRKTRLYALLPLLLAACVAPPKIIRLAPVATVNGQGIGRGTPVSVSAADLRPERSGGVPAGAYMIDPKVDVAAIVYRAATDGLSRLGYQPVPGEGPWQSNLKLEVLRVAQGISGNAVLKTVSVEAEIRATASNRQRSYTTSYRAQQQQDFPFGPRTETVQRLTNEAVSNALSRVLNDQAVLEVLTAAGATGGAGVGQDTQTFPYPQNP